MKYPKQTENYDVDVFNDNFYELDLKGDQLERDLHAESDRANAAEKANADAITAEAERATAQETILDNKFTAEAVAIRALIDAAYASANGYTDNKIASLVNGAPETLDTLKEIADALEQNEDVVEALNNAIGTKADQNELDFHTGDTTIHVTSADKSKWNNPVFTEASTRTNISSGDSTPTLWGKVKKWFSDLKAVAFSGSYKDLMDVPAIGNGKITITQNGVTKGTFTTNQTGNATIALTDTTSAEGLPKTTKYALSDTVGGDALKLKNFQVTQNADLGISTPKNAIGYIIGSSEIYGISDGAVYEQAYNSEYFHQIYGDYRTGQIATRGKNNGAWQPWRRQLDEQNYSDYIRKYTETVKYNTTEGAGGYIKVRFKTGNIRWMLSCVVSVYQAYNSYRFNIQGYFYNIESTIWYSPKVCCIETSDVGMLDIAFGYEIISGCVTPFIAFFKNNYCGVSVSDFTNGYTGMEQWADKVEIVHEDTISGTIQQWVSNTPIPVCGNSICKMQSITKAQYDAMGSGRDPYTLYIVKG